MQQTLRYTDAKSDKFWHIETLANQFVVNYGKYGTNGRYEIKEFDSPEACEKQAAKLAAAEADAAAIAGKMAAERYGVPLRYPHIEDDGNNTTRFLVIGKQASSPSGHDKTTILVSSQNRPGLLYKLLEPIGRHGINMTRIESRPSKQGIWEYIFFIDLDGHQSEPQMQALLAEIEDSASLFRVLGSYPQSVLQ